MLSLSKKHIGWLGSRQVLPLSVCEEAGSGLIMLKCGYSFCETSAFFKVWGKIGVTHCDTKMRYFKCLSLVTQYIKGAKLLRPCASDPNLKMIKLRWLIPIVLALDPGVWFAWHSGKRHHSRWQVLCLSMDQLFGGGRVKWNWGFVAFCSMLYSLYSQYCMGMVTPKPCWCWICTWGLEGMLILWIESIIKHKQSKYVEVSKRWRQQ